MTTALAVGGASPRLIESAARILGHTGGTAVFRRKALGVNKLKGSEEWTVDSTVTPFEARCLRYTDERRKQDGERERKARISIERAPFETYGGLSDRWEVELAEGWTPLENVLLGDDATTWEAELCPVRTS